MGCISAFDEDLREVWIVDAHQGDAMRYIAQAEEKLAAFWALEEVLREATAAPTFPA